MAVRFQDKYPVAHLSFVVCFFGSTSALWPKEYLLLMDRNKSGRHYFRMLNLLATKNVNVRTFFLDPSSDCKAPPRKSCCVHKGNFMIRFWLVAVLDKCIGGLG